MFRNSPEPTKTESEKAFELSFINSIGNVKAFILSICLAVLFATLLVSATTMAMSIRERTREVAVLKTLGFNRETILKPLYRRRRTRSLDRRRSRLPASPSAGLQPCRTRPEWACFLPESRSRPTFARHFCRRHGRIYLSAIIPAYHSSKLNIVEGLRYIG
jgi:hypothetical protein